MEHLVIEPERQRFLGRLVREVARADLVAIEHAARESRRLGEDAPPAIALRAVAAHATEMRPRFGAIVSGYEIPLGRSGLGAALATLRDLVVDRIVQGERAYRIAMLDLRHGLDVVKLLRAAARADQLIGLIRWCDDWLVARRPLVSHAERELAWFTAAPAPSVAGTRTEQEPGDAEIEAGEPGSSDDRPSSHDHR
jgi:hypothetical protein